METLAWKPRAVAARTVSDVAAWGEIARMIAGNVGPIWAYPIDIPGRIPTGPGYARTGLQEGGDTGAWEDIIDSGTREASGEIIWTDTVSGDRWTDGTLGESPEVPHGDTGEHPAELRAAIARHLDVIGL